MRDPLGFPAPDNESAGFRPTPRALDADAPRFDAAREERLRWLLTEFARGKPSSKAFDLEEMETLRDDLDAMLREIDTLRSAARLRAGEAPRTLDQLPAFNDGPMTDSPPDIVAAPSEPPTVPTWEAISEMISEDILAGCFHTATQRAMYALYDERERLLARVAELEEDVGSAGECIVMAQELLDHLVFIDRLDKGTAAMFLPEAIKNACILCRDEALAYANDEHRTELLALRATVARLAGTALTDKEMEAAHGLIGAIIGAFDDGSMPASVRYFLGEGGYGYFNTQDSAKDLLNRLWVAARRAEHGGDATP